MKKIKYFITFTLLLFTICAHPQVPYTSEMTKYIGSWIEPKSVDYQGRLKVDIFNSNGIILVRAAVQFPDDLPTNRSSIPVDNVLYEDGKLITYGQRKGTGSKPTYKLVINAIDGSLEVSEFIGNDKSDMKFVSKHHLEVN